MRSSSFPLAVVCAAGLIASGSSLAQPPGRIKIGTLACDVSGSIGLIVSSKKSVACIFMPAQPGPREVYTGAIAKFGLDVGATAEAEMVWAVFAPGGKHYGALAGTYAGAGVEATMGAGLGAHVLVGGSNRSVSLQPLSLQAQTGLNLAAGVAELQLRPAQ